MGYAGDRPIGITSQTADKVGFDPKLITLDYPKAKMIAETDFGKGPGVLTFKYTDSSQFTGDYDLYLQVRQVS
jgi:hypothetical protein